MKTSAPARMSQCTIDCSRYCRVLPLKPISLGTGCSNRGDSPIFNGLCVLDRDGIDVSTTKQVARGSFLVARPACYAFSAGRWSPVSERRATRDGPLSSCSHPEVALHPCDVVQRFTFVVDRTQPVGVGVASLHGGVESRERLAVAERPGVRRHHLQSVEQVLSKGRRLPGVGVDQLARDPVTARLKPVV